jgi:hypothetical protein
MTKEGQNALMLSCSVPNSCLYITRIPDVDTEAWGEQGLPVIQQ